MTGYIELTRLKRLIIWMRRNKMNFSEIGKSLGILACLPIVWVRLSAFLRNSTGNLFNWVFRSICYLMLKMSKEALK